MSVKRKVYYADFETTQPDANNRVRVYLWCLIDGKNKRHGFDIESFITEVNRLGKCVIYFHNLRFDFSYIHYYLLKHNIECDVLEKQGVIYTVHFGKIELRDSMNFMPMTLKEVGENYCNFYKKTSIDYNVGWDHEATPIEIEYCYNDCYVLMEGLTNYFDALHEVLINAGCVKTADKLHKKLTNAGIAYEAFKELSEFEHCCPKTTQAEYELYKDAYKGGFVYSNPQGIVKDVQMIDCNSMYPFMYSTIDMPIGRGIPCLNEEELKRFKFYIIHVVIQYDLKPGYIPIIGGGVGRYGGINYKAYSDDYEELTLASQDFELIKLFYNIDYKFVWGVGFDTMPAMFQKYADTFIKVKNKEKGIKRQVAKVLLNSPYGKTAMNGFNEIRSYEIDEETETVKGRVTGYEVDFDSYQYLPIAIAITASARHYLLTTAEQIGFENVYYMDTDSIKFKNCETGIVYDSNTLGAWKDEGLVKYFKTIAPKKYVYFNANGDYKINFTCAGFNKKVLVANMHHTQRVLRKNALELMRQFDKGFTLDCLQSKVVKGGRALLTVKKEIK